MPRSPSRAPSTSGKTPPAPDATRRSATRGAADALLGGFTPAQFMRRFWHKQPLLVRGAAQGLDLSVDREDLLALACRDDVESRLIRRDRGHWQLEHGPFKLRALHALPRRDWTLLVQGVNLVHPPAAALLARFDFVPHARVDDVMVSYAAPGGGVGPHFDSYDVFLVQGVGRRRWQVSAQGDLALRDGVPVKLLRRFVPEGTATLDAGDLLYLPPRFAHDGVAVEACTTWSVGFRAPTVNELARGFLEHLAEHADLPGRYADPRQPATLAPGCVPDALVDAALDAVRRVRATRRGAARFVGEWLTRPKPHVFLDPPLAPLSLHAFQHAAALAGITLDPRAQLLYRSPHVFVDGETLHFPRGVPDWLTTLADRRGLSAAAWPGSAHPLLWRWYTDGIVQLAR
jgi:50S ribosomal protein L16 3-hydroxylase